MKVSFMFMKVLEHILQVLQFKSVLVSRFSQFVVMDLFWITTKYRTLENQKQNWSSSLYIIF